VRVVDLSPVRLLSEEIARAERDLPGLLPPFDPRNFFSRRGPGYEFYKVDGIRAYLAAALAKLDAEIQLLKRTPITEQREFKFISDNGLRHIIERDYAEIQRAFVSGCWKSVIILAGSIIEAILAVTCPPKTVPVAAKQMSISDTHAPLPIAVGSGVFFSHRLPYHRQQ